MRRTGYRLSDLRSGSQARTCRLGIQLLPFRLLYFHAILFFSFTQGINAIMQSPGVLQGPCCFDALSAKLIERAGFPYCITTGFSISATRLGLPDKGLISYGEMVDQGQQITQSVSIPVIGYGGNGYGNAMNVKRTVKGYIRAGFAGIVINDQVCCAQRRVVSREEAVMRVKAAVDARRECDSDIVIVAQIDSREAISLEELLIRARAFIDAGADVLSIDSLVSREEMKSFCNVYPLVPKLANLHHCQLYFSLKLGTSSTKRNSLNPVWCGSSCLPSISHV